MRGLSGGAIWAANGVAWWRSLMLVVSVLLAVLPMALCGCAIEVGLSTTVEEDGSGEVGVRLAADKELQNYISRAAEGLSGLGSLGSYLEDIEDQIPEDVDVLFALILGSIPTDWAVDQGTDDNGARWISLSHAFADLEELEDLAGGRVLSTFVDPDRFSLAQDEGFFCTKTIISISGGLRSTLERARQAGPSLPREVLGEVLTLENRVTLPGTVKDNNADRIQGNTLIWEVGLSGSRDMYGESLSYDWVRIGIVAFAALIGLTVVILLSIWFVRARQRRRRARTAPPPVPTPASGGSPPPPPPDPPSSPRPPTP